MDIGTDALLLAVVVILFAGFGLLTDTVSYDVSYPLLVFGLLLGLGGFAQSLSETLRERD